MSDRARSACRACPRRYKSQVLESFERELKFFYEHAKEYGEEFPDGEAAGLGGLAENTMDPGLGAVPGQRLHGRPGAAGTFRSEFAEFTSALLDQLVPGCVAPIPSALLVQAAPPFNDKNLADGRSFPAGSYLDAVYVERDRRVSCRYRLAAPLTVWPVHLEAAHYHASAAPLQALGLETAPGTAAGLRLTFRRRTMKLEDDKPGAADPGAPVNELPIDVLPVHLVGSSVDTTALYEQLFAHCSRITFRYLDAFGDPRFVAAPPDMLRQIGFEENEPLFGHDDRVFTGFALLRDFFVFPRSSRAFAWKSCAGRSRPSPPRLSTCCSSSTAPSPGSLRWSIPRSFRFMPRPPRTCSRCSARGCRCRRASIDAASFRIAAVGSISRRIASSTCSPITAASGRRCRCFRSTACRPAACASTTRSSTPPAGCRAARRRRNAASGSAAIMSARRCSSRCASRPASMERRIHGAPACARWSATGT